jgi:hypothetical protein
VNVVDTTAPVITLLGDPVVTVPLNDGYVDAGATASDVVDGDVTSLILTVGLPVDTSTVGSYTVTYDVSDAAGNPATQVSRTVDVVLDGVPPVITLVGVTPVDVEAGSVYVDAGATALDNVDGDLTGSIVTVNPVDTSALGSYVVTYDVVDSSGNPAIQVVRTVNVVDTTAPVITLLGDPVVTVDVFVSYSDAGATAWDEVDGDLTASILTVNPVDTDVVGAYTVTYDVSDASGNAATQVVRTVEVVDNVAPVITLLGEALVTVEGGDSYSDAGASASDNYDGDLTAAIVTTNPVDTSTVGTYVVTYDVSDTAGNAAVQVVRTVEVVDTTAPVIALSGVNPQVIEVGDPYVELGATALDIVDGDLSAAIQIDDTAVNTSLVGSYPVTYDVSDLSGNAATRMVRTVDVVAPPDTTPPVITLLGDDPQTIEGGDSYVELGASAVDDVDGDISADLEIDSSAVDTSLVGSYPVTYDVQDSSGNAAIQVSRTVNVVDTTAPTITLLGDPSITVEVGSTYDDAGATAADIVDGDLTSSIVTVNPVDTDVVGAYTVTYDVSDAAENAAVQVTRTVEVVAAPVIADIYAGSETTVLGTVAAGDLSATTASDDTYEVLAEHHQGGRPSKRVSALDHRWTFEIGNPDQVVLIIEARRAANADGDDFAIEYSTDGAPFQPLLVSDSVPLVIDSENDSVQQASLPPGTAGTVTIRVVDTDRTEGNASPDEVYIDQLLLRTTTGSSGLPQVSVAATGPNASEAGASGEFTLTRSNSDGPLTVEVALAGTAGSGDYDTVDTSVAFVAGSSTATVQITPVDDSEIEGSETVMLTVVPGSGYDVGIPNTAEVTIADNDVTEVDHVALAEETVHGTASGGLVATHTPGSGYEAITEESHVGGKRSRLEHIWTFDVTGGSSVVFSVEAYRSDTSDAFVFAYSTDGANWVDMLTVSKTSDDDSTQTFPLPLSISGTVYVRVQDTDRSKDDPDLATVWVDHMFIRSG